MKGITKKLRDLAVGERMLVPHPAERSNIHKIATRVGIKVTIEKVDGGFYVTKREAKGK